MSAAGEAVTTGDAEAAAVIGVGVATEVVGIGVVTGPAVGVAGVAADAKTVGWTEVATDAIGVLTVLGGDFGLIPPIGFILVAAFGRENTTCGLRVGLPPASGVVLAAVGVAVAEAEVACIGEPIGVAGFVSGAGTDVTVGLEAGAVGAVTGLGAVVAGTGVGAAAAVAAAAASA